MTYETIDKETRRALLGALEDLRNEVAGLASRIMLALDEPGRIADTAASLTDRCARVAGHATDAAEIVQRIRDARDEVERQAREATPCA